MVIAVFSVTKGCIFSGTQVSMDLFKLKEHQQIDCHQLNYTFILFDIKHIFFKVHLNYNCVTLVILNFSIEILHLLYKYSFFYLLFINVVFLINQNKIFQ